MKQWIQMAAASSALLGLPALAALPAVQARGAAVLLPVMQQTAEHYMQHTPGATVTVGGRAPRAQGAAEDRYCAFFIASARVSTISSM